MINYKLNDNIFREYDIRGVVEQDFSKYFIYDLGLAIGTKFLNKWKGKKGTKSTIDNFFNKSPTSFATFPLTPASISSKIIVGIVLSKVNKDFIDNKLPSGYARDMPSLSVTATIVEFS